MHQSPGRALPGGQAPSWRLTTAAMNGEPNSGSAGAGVGGCGLSHLTATK